MENVRQGEQSSDISDGGSAGPDPNKLVAAALKRERTRAGLSIAELARRAGIGKSTLSQLETGDGNPSVETLWALSTALGIQFSALVDSPARPVEVIRFGDGPVISSAAADYSATLLSAAAPGSRRDAYLIRAEPGSARRSDPHARGVVEHVISPAAAHASAPTTTPSNSPPATTPPTPATCRTSSRPSNPAPSPSCSANRSSPRSAERRTSLLRVLNDLCAGSTAVRCGPSEVGSGLTAQKTAGDARGWPGCAESGDPASFSLTYQYSRPPISSMLIKLGELPRGA